ncbi:ankyrin repeat-containing domain protein [Lactarius deliciosus]|nr:ankyrin repeat-containing domain protein [Lactarius deliciosus]
MRDPVDQDVADNISLAPYAARHWVTHAQVENVASRIRDGIQYLFDPSNPYFSSWVRLHDVDYASLLDDFHTEIQPEAAPLYHAAFCGLNEVVTNLVFENPQYASAIGGGCGTALHAASLQGHVQVVRSLLQCGVDVDVRGLWNWTPLHYASWWGSVNVVQCLLDYGADANSRGELQATPLSVAAIRGRLDVVRVLLVHRADVSCRDSRGPLHLVPSSRLEVARILLEHGADVDAEDQEGRTPFLAASEEGRNPIARLLSEYRSR